MSKAAKPVEPAGDPQSSGALTNLFRGRPDAPKRGRPKKDDGTPAKKKNLSEGFDLFYGMAGGALSFAGGKRLRDGSTYFPNYRAGRIMQIQASTGIAGREFNAWVREHDFVYSMVEPILGMEGVSFVSSVLAPPLMMVLLEHRPELFPMLRPVLTRALWDIWKAMKTFEKKEQEILEDVFGDNAEARTAQREFESFVGSFFGEEQPAESSPFGSGPEANTATERPPSSETEHESGPDTFPPAEPVPAVDLGPPMAQPDGDGQGEWVNGVWFPRVGSQAVPTEPGPFPT